MGFSWVFCGVPCVYIHCSIPELMKQMKRSTNSVTYLWVLAESIPDTTTTPNYIRNCKHTTSHAKSASMGQTLAEYQLV
jgi:hypothetical protein